MRNFLEYFVLLVVLIVLQIFLLDNISLSIYVYPMIYVAFIILLPLNIQPGLLLILGGATGLILDFFTGTAGIHTITSLATALLRPAIYGLTLGKEAASEGIMPLPRTVGQGRWLRSAALLMLLHCLVFFFTEALTLSHIGFTLLRILGSWASGMLCIWFVALVYPQGLSSRKN